MKKLSERHGVQISIPRSDNSEIIAITGYETNANDCRDEIEQTVKDLEAMITHQIKVDSRFHPRLIGTRGKNLRKV